MVTISFKDYFVDKLEYKENHFFEEEETEKYIVNNEFSANVAYKDDRGMVILNVDVGEADNKNCPFLISLKLIGLFEYTSEDTEEDLNTLKHMLTSNAVAILYPYARSLVSDMTLRSNKYPPFILPVANIVQAMTETDAISIYDYDELKQNYSQIN